MNGGSHLGGRGVVAISSILHPPLQTSPSIKRYWLMAEEPTSASLSDGLQPGHDIFCTPQNDAVPASSLYSELDVAQQEIRLVKLWPGTEDDVIECTLLSGRPLLDLKGRYTAPSYCAGSAKNTESIVLNDMPFNVFANLAHALKEVRNFWKATYGGRECLLWIDQISINQYDINERSHQVRFMREIYEYAEQVLVCLSTEKADPKGMDWSIKVARDVRPRGFDEIPRGERRIVTSDSHDDLDDKQRADIIDYDHQSLIADHVIKHTRSVDWIEEWLASYEVIEAPWFTRAWVLQEFIVAANVYFMYSGVFASWRTVLPVWRAIYSTWRFRVNQAIGMMTEDRHLSGLPERRHPRRLWVDTERGDLRVGMVEAIFTINSKVQSRQNQDLKELLAHSRNRHTSDPRDKIFAYIGLADPAYDIVPNYSHPVDQVLIDTTIRIIETENSLDILWHAAASATQHTTGLPSWVVDWRCKQDRRSPAAKPYDNVLKKSEANISFHTIRMARGISQALQVDGVFIARLDEDSSNIAWGRYYSYSCAGEIWGTCSRPSRRGDEMWVLRGCNFPLILRFQEEQAYTLVSAARCTNYCSGPPELMSLEDLLRQNEEKQGGWRSIYII